MPDEHTTPGGAGDTNSAQGGSEFTPAMGGENSEAGAAPEGGAGGETAPEGKEGFVPAMGGEGEASEGDKADGDKAEGEAPEGKEGEDGGEVPESYSLDKVELPEGVEVSDALLESFTPVAKELGLSQEKFDKAAKWFAEQQAEQEQARTNELIRFFDDRDKTRLDALRSDPEIGGDRLRASHQLVNRFLKTFDTDGEAVKYLGEMREQFNPALFKIFHRAAKAMSDDVLVGGNPPKDAREKPAYERMGWKPLEEYSKK